MPQVGDRQFPYTPEGLEAARIYEEQLRGKMSPLNALTRATADRARRQQIVGPRPDRATSRIRQQTNPYRSMTQMIQNRPDRRGPSERLIEEFTRQRQRPVTVPRPNVPGTVWDERIPPELGGDASGQWRGRRPGIPVQNPDEWERGVRASYDKINEMMESLPPADRADPMKRRALLEAKRDDSMMTGTGTATGMRTRRGDGGCDNGARCLGGRSSRTSSTSMYREE